MYRSPPGARGFFLTIGLLGGALVASFVLGLLTYWGLQAAFPRPLDNQYPGYLTLIFTAVFLLPLTVLLARRFPFIADWYYLLPAIVFLLAFTVYPIILTVYFGFTDYTGLRNGKADRSTETPIVRVEGNTLIAASNAAQSLRCERADCAGERLEITTTIQRATVRVIRVEGPQIVLNAPPPFTPNLAYHINAYRFIGFGNYVEIFSRASTILWPVFVWNVAFAAGAVAVGALAGLILGLLLSNKQLKLRGFYRTALIISWAIPGVISYQVWSAMLNVNFGPVNRLLGLLGTYPIPWLTDPEWAKVAVLLTSLWLGFPYWMTATLGALTTIPDDVYEAAKIDGATGWQTLTGITLPLLRQPFTPLLLGSFAFNFNNFGLIYLLTGGGPAAQGRPSTAQSTDILISWAYKTAFQADGGQAYGLGGAISVIIFVITVAISLINFRVTGALREVR
ncbi:MULTISPECIES: ABC transporter permease subunit [unclassified Meiothermus]|uniref:ABC transporter permease subunit n=1 Tax=unclassified Meiothermus TaxID=370471 RepID=UPI000D7C9554|nr:MULTISPECIES: ABC transporter permease subunit [unclassified Meiothermus]PZA08609.1 sugar ABC transporter permease [Meiothermus sp. Pnk-1]RYM40773.1 ABC transporter permease subunit [Meiothermus sp. PNK-Is4]